MLLAHSRQLAALVQASDCANGAGHEGGLTVAMGVSLTKDSIEVWGSSSPTLSVRLPSTATRSAGDADAGRLRMYRLMCGADVIKLVVSAKELPGPPPGGVDKATDRCYWTISVDEDVRSWPSTAATRSPCRRPSCSR